MDQKPQDLTVSEIEAHDGQAWYTCPECGERNHLDPNMRVSELSSMPRRCEFCTADIFWYDVDGRRGMVSFNEMGKVGMIRDVLPFRSSA